MTASTAPTQPPDKCPACKSGQALVSGQRVTWIWKPRGGYGYEIPCRAEVIRTTSKRVVIRVWRIVNGQEIPEEKIVKSESIKVMA